MFSKKEHWSRRGDMVAAKLRENGRKICKNSAFRPVHQGNFQKAGTCLKVCTANRNDNGVFVSKGWTHKRRWNI